MSTTNITLQISQPDPLEIAKITPFFPTETQGEPGETPMLRMLAQALQWKYVSEGNGAYQTLFDFDDLELPISQIISLQDELDAKLPTSYVPVWDDVSGKPSTFTPATHSHAIADITFLQAALDAKAPQSTTDTKTEVDNKIAAAIANLINSAPGALDTLNELATSLGNDPNFATTVTNSLAGKVSLSGSYSKPAWLTQVAASIIEQSASYRFVTDTEKNTWNAKQNALSGGTANYFTKWTAVGTVGNSAMQDDGSKIYSGRKTVIGAADVQDVTFAVNLDGANSEFYVGTNSVGNTQRLFISQARRSNYGDMLIGMNLTGVSASDAYKTRSNATGYSGINFEYNGNISLFASTAATTNNGAVTPAKRIFIDGSTGGVIFNNTAFAASEKFRFTGDTLFDSGSTVFRTSATATNAARGIIITPADHDAMNIIQARGSSGGLGLEHWSTATATVLAKIEIAGGLVRFYSQSGSTFSEAMRIVHTTQNVLVGTIIDVPSSLLTLASTTKGVLIPRMTTAQRDAISSPATMLIIANTTTNKLNFYNGSAWEVVTSA